MANTKLDLTCDKLTKSFVQDFSRSYDFKIGNTKFLLISNQVYDDLISRSLKNIGV